MKTRTAETSGQSACPSAMRQPAGVAPFGVDRIPQRRTVLQAFVDQSPRQRHQRSDLEAILGRHDVAPSASAPSSPPALRRAEGPPVQRYSLVSSGYVWGYGKGKGANAPSFEFQQTEFKGTPDPATMTTSYGFEGNQVVESAPVLRVSDDRQMAVPTRDQSEAKSFFATPGKIADSNVALHDAGAPVRLVAGSGQIRLSNGVNPFGPTLESVTPDMSNVDNNSSECNKFAENILGTPVYNAESALDGAPPQTQELKGGGVSADRDLSIDTLLGGHAPESVGANSRATPEVGEAFGIYARVRGPAAIGLMASLWSGIEAVRNRLTTVDEPATRWAEHWAGVVARSGGDVVTLENYNRPLSDRNLKKRVLETDYAELKGAGGNYAAATAKYAKRADEGRLARLLRLGRNYLQYAYDIRPGMTGAFNSAVLRSYFQMYGSGGQSFHEQWKGVVPEGVTFKTGGTDAELQDSLATRLNALLPFDSYRDGALPELVAQTTLVRNAVGRTAIIAAFVAGEKAVCVARLDRALAVERLEPHDTDALERAHGQAVNDVNGKSGDAVNQACRDGIAAMLST